MLVVCICIKKFFNIDFHELTVFFQIFVSKEDKAQFFLRNNSL